MNLADLATALELELHGDGSHVVTTIAPIASAGNSDLSFVVSARYRQQLIDGNAGVVIVPSVLANDARGNYLVSKDPYASYAKASWLLTPEQRPLASIHSTANIDPSATISSTASIGAYCSIGADVHVGDDAIIGDHCVLADGVKVGVSTRLFPRVSVYHACLLGDQCRVQSGAVIGAEGFGFAFSNGWQPIHQTGRVVIGSKVHIGANTTIDRGAIDDTVIADGVILDNQIQIAHNVRIGENTAIAGCVGIAGSTVIGSNCQIGGACNIVGHIQICDGVVLNATSFVSRSITEAGRYSSGGPLQRSTEWKRSFVILSKLNQLLSRVRKLEQRDK